MGNKHSRHRHHYEINQRLNKIEGKIDKINTDIEDHNLMVSNSIAFPSTASFELQGIREKLENAVRSGNTFIELNNKDLEILKKVEYKVLIIKQGLKFEGNKLYLKQPEVEITVQRVMNDVEFASSKNVDVELNKNHQILMKKCVMWNGAYYEIDEKGKKLLTRKPNAVHDDISGQSLNNLMKSLPFTD